MKFISIALAASTASLAYAQIPVPACALNCFLPKLSSDGCSSLLDFECHCNKGQSLVGEIEPCILSACTNPTDLQDILSTANAFCKQYNVVLSITLPASLSSLAAGASTVAPVTGLDASSVLASVTDTAAASAAASSFPSSSSGPANSSATLSASSASETETAAETAAGTAAATSSGSNPFGFLSSIASEITSGATQTRLTINTTPTATGSTASTLQATPSATASAGFAAPREVSGGLLGAVIAFVAAML